MEMSEIQAAWLLLGGDGSAGQAASRQAGSEPASVRYGEVKAVGAEAGTVTVLLDGQSQEIVLTDATASTRLKAGDRVKIVKQGQSWVIDLAGGISRALDTAVLEASARMDAHDKAMAEQQKDIEAAQDELAKMDGKISDAVDDALSKLETPDGGNHIYAGADEPTPPKDGFKAGDLWYQTNASGQIAAVKVWNGTVWNAYDMVANSILVAGSVGSTLIADGAVTTAKITAKAITADQIAANTITGDEIKAASVDVNNIASDDIYCKRLTAVSGQGYAEITGGSLELSNNAASGATCKIEAHNDECKISSPSFGKVSIWGGGSSLFACREGGYSFSSMFPGFKVNNLSAVESYPVRGVSATNSFSATVHYSPPNLSFACIYYRCTYTNTVGSVKFPLVKGGSANVVLKELMGFETGEGESIAVGCAENITVAIDSASVGTLTVTRGNPYRFAVKPSGNSINANPGTQFEITQVTLCG